MKLLLKISFIFFYLALQSAFSDVPYYIDFKYILNSSVAGKKAQDELKKRLEQGVASLEKKKNDTRRREKLIQQKKVISPEEYKKKYRS